MKKIDLDIKEIKKIVNLKKTESIREICRITKYSQALIQRVLSEENKLIRFNIDKNYVAICKKTNKTFKDYKNSSGILITHIKNEYPEIEIPSKFIRKKFEIERGVKWYERFFSIKEIDKETIETMKCKLCSWDTVDLQNIGIAYAKHIINVHNLEINKYLELFPDDELLFIKL